MAKSLQEQLKAIADKRIEDVEDIMSASMLRMGNRIILDSPVDEGRFVNNWMSAVDRVDKSTRNTVSVGGADSRKDLLEVTSNIQIGATFYFSNSLPYAHRLEYEGWSAQAPKGMVRVNAMYWDNIVQEEVNKRK